MYGEIRDQAGQLAVVDTSCECYTSLNTGDLVRKCRLLRNQNLVTFIFTASFLKSYLMLNTLRNKYIIACYAIVLCSPCFVIYDFRRHFIRCVT